LPSRQRPSRTTRRPEFPTYCPSNSASSDSRLINGFILKR
jgi:hypothetical protein